MLAQHLVLEDSLEASMVRTLQKKQELIDAAVDGTARSDARRDDLFEGPYAEAPRAEAAEQRAEASEVPLPTTSGRLPARRARRPGERPR